MIDRMRDLLISKDEIRGKSLVKIIFLFFEAVKIYRNNNMVVTQATSEISNMHIFKIICLAIQLS